MRCLALATTTLCTVALLFGLSSLASSHTRLHAFARSESKVAANDGVQHTVRPRKALRKQKVRLKHGKKIRKLKRPDLTVKAKWRAGSGVRKVYDFTLRNNGTAKAPATKLRITLGPPCLRPGVMKTRRTITHLDVKSLKPTTSKSMEFKIAWELPAKWMGTGCQLRAAIDPAKKIQELKEHNNVGKAGTRHERKPDLVLVTKWGNGPWSGEIGVKNKGDANAGPSKLSFRCESFKKSVLYGNEYWPCNPQGKRGLKTATWNVPSIARGEIWWRKLPLPAPYPTNSRWTVRADAAKQIKEWDETNNSRGN